MLLAASLLTIAEAGGEAASLQALSDKVSYTGHDIERMIRYMTNNKLPIDTTTLNALAENYRAATGLLVETTPVGIYPLWTHVQDTGENHWAGTIYCQIEDVVPLRKWRYKFEDLNESEWSGVEPDYNEPVLLVERLDGRLRITVEMHEGAYIVDVNYSTQTLWTNVGAHVGESVEVDELFLRLNNIITDIRDPKGAARYTENISLT
jgi:hypothetical protein